MKLQKGKMSKACRLLLATHSLFKCGNKLKIWSHDW